MSIIYPKSDKCSAKPNLKSFVLCIFEGLTYIFVSWRAKDRKMDIRVDTVYNILLKTPNTQT